MTPEEVADAVIRRFGVDERVSVERSHDTITVLVPGERWLEALTFARDELGCTFFDWLTAVDELSDGFLIVAHVYAIAGGHHLLLRVRVPRDAPTAPSAVEVFAGANWHERETHEMFGVEFEGHPNLTPLLLPEGFEGHPLRKEFVLAARAAKTWPGAKEPGESDHEAARSPSRRRMLPPGVPDPDEWGPDALSPQERAAKAAAGPSRATRSPRGARRPGPAPTESAPTESGPTESGPAGSEGEPS